MTDSGITAHESIALLSPISKKTLSCSHKFPLFSLFEIIATRSFKSLTDIISYMAFSQKLNDTTQAGHAPKTDSSSELKKGKKSQIKKVSHTEPSQELPKRPFLFFETAAHAGDL